MNEKKVKKEIKEKEIILQVPLGFDFFDFYEPEPEGEDLGDVTRETKEGVEFER